MSSTTCNDCEDYSCANDLNECLSTIRVGRIAQINTPVYVHIVKENGAEHIQPVTSDASGFIDISATDPDEYFYNHLDGTYKLYVMLGGYFANGDKQIVTVPGGTFTEIGFKFRKSTGVRYTTQHITLS